MKTATTPEPAPGFLQGVRDCVPTLFGYIGLGFAAGIVGSSAGLSAAEIGLMSALIYAGAAQFIICAMLIAMSPPSAIVATTFIVNLRHVLMGTALAPYFTRESLLANIGFGALLTDESFGVAANRAVRGLPLSGSWMNGLNLTAYLAWIGSTVAGGLLGSRIADPQAYGLDFALTAMFAALLVLQLHAQPSSRLKHSLLLIALTVLAMLVLPLFFTTYTAVLLSTMAVAAVGAVTGR